MALSAIDICARALLKVGARTISSFDEGNLEAEVAGNLYPIVRDALLSAHPWNFAIIFEDLPRLAEAPKADFEAAFPLPTDCLRVLSAGLPGTSRGLIYRVIGRSLYADADAVTISYIGRPSEDTFPAFFDMALIAQLAAEFCIPLTENTSRWESLRQFAESEFRRAKLIDSQEDTPPRIDDFTLLQGRA